MDSRGSESDAGDGARFSGSQDFSSEVFLVECPLVALFFCGGLFWPVSDIGDVDRRRCRLLRCSLSGLRERDLVGRFDRCLIESLDLRS